MKNLNLLLIALSLIGITNIWAQPSIQWEKSLGGSDADLPEDMKRTPDGGFIVVGASRSSDGDLSTNTNHGDFDLWITKLDEDGNIEWQKNYGGPLYDVGSSIALTSDGGYIIAGILSKYFGTGLMGYWILKINHIGEIQWQTTLGGSGVEKPHAVVQTQDGGFIIGGSSNSDDGDVTQNYGGVDMWIVKLDPLGAIEWEKSLGGSDEDACYDIKQTPDGGYIAVGQTWSNDWDVSYNHGLNDGWIVKLDPSGNLQWEKTLGWNSNDVLSSVELTDDGGYIVAGTSQGESIGGPINFDVLVVKLDDMSNVEWQNLYGGTSHENSRDIIQTADGGYVVSGYTESNDGDVIGNHGGQDCWVLGLDGSGNLAWQIPLGGSSDEKGRAIQSTPDGGFSLVGYSNSIDGDVSGNHGTFDYWVVKLRCPLSITCQSDVTVPSDPGICGASVAFNAPSEYGNCTGVGVNQTAGPESGSVFPVGTTTVSFLATDATGSTASCSFTVTVTSDLTAYAGPDEMVIIDSGPGPDPYPCTPLDAAASGGTGPYTWSWEPTPMPGPIACPTTTTTYTLTVTDANGCTSTDERTVTVIDIDDTGSLPLVGNNSNKVYVCHLATCTTVEANVQANCNSPHSLCAHLAHGDELGECTCKNGSGEGDRHVHDLIPQLNAYPNPFTNTTTLTFSVEHDCRATLSVFDITGKEVARPFDGAAKTEKLHIATLDGTGLGSGIYFYTLKTDLGESFTKTLVLSR